MSGDTSFPESNLTAGIASAELIANPASWINRRVETVELLSQEQTRRRVSIDFTLSDSYIDELTTPEGLVVPISVLTKELRRHFDLRDESGSAVPVLGKEGNAGLAHIAVMSAALDVLPDDVPSEAFELIWSDLRQVVTSSPEAADEALGVFVGSAEEDDTLRSAIWQDATCRSLLNTLRSNYVLFAVIPPEGPKRRILKYSYSEDFDVGISGTLRERLAPWMIGRRLSRPDRSRIRILCPGAWRAASFHAEVVIPEDLRVEAAILYDFAKDEALSESDLNRNRASLYASETLDAEASVDAYVVIAPERRGRTIQAAATGLVVAALLWLGVHSGLDAKQNPDAAVSLLLAGAALYSGVTAGHGEHVLVTKLFSASRRWLAVVSLAALTASAALAMQVPNAYPTGVWRVAAIACTVASGRLLWSAIRAPG
jgi:hypothetical protein